MPTLARRPERRSIGPAGFAIATLANGFGGGFGGLDRLVGTRLDGAYSVWWECDCGCFWFALASNVGLVVVVVVVFWVVLVMVV